MEKLKLFSREQVGNAPLTGRQYSRPDSLSLVSRQSVLAFLLVLLTTVFGVGNAWGETSVYTFSSNAWASSVSTGGTSCTWTGSANANQYNATQNPKGAQITTAKNGLTITSNVSFSNVTSVVVKYNSTKNGVGNIGVQIGSTEITAQDISKSQTDKELTFTPAIATSGVIVVKFNCSTNSYAIVSVTVTTGSGDQPTPSLDHIAITGTPSKTYEQGQSFDPTGLTVTAYYDDDTDANVTGDVEWSFNPATFTVAGENKSVKATATYQEKEASVTYNDITVNEHVVTPGEYDITPNNTFFNTEASGSITGDAASLTYSGTQNDITITYAKGSQSNMYINATQTRAYNGSVMTFSVPSGYNITAIAFTADGNNWGGTHTASAGTMTDNKNWSGAANSVTITFGGTCRITGISVTYAEVVPEVTVDPSSLTFTAKQNIAVEGKTFTLTGANLESGLSLVASAGYSVSPTSLTAEAAMAQGGVEETVTPATPTTATTPVNGTVTISGGGLADDVVVNLMMSVTATYAVALAVNDNTMGSATINGGTATVYAEYADEVTLVATANTGYEFVNWTVSDGDIDLGEDAAKANGAVAVIGAAGTITANFQAQSCSVLDAPVLDGAIATTYNSATINWAAVANADGYNVEVKLGDVVKGSDAILEAPLSYTVNNLEANTTYNYTIQTVGDGTTYCEESGVLAGSFTTADYPSVAVTYSENGNEVSGGNKQIMTAFALPTEVSHSCAKTFVGWTTKSDFADGDESLASYYAKGAEFTIESNAAVMLYAVYADITGGGTSTTNIKYTGSTTSTLVDGENEADVFGLDESDWSVISHKHSANTVGVNKDGTIRLYYNQNGNTSLEIIAPQTITSVGITCKENTDNIIVKVGDNTITPESGVYPINATSFEIVNGYTSNTQVHITNIAVNFASAGTASNYSTTCAAAPEAEADADDVAALANVVAAGANGTIAVTYDNVDVESVSVALFNDAACTIAFDGEWLTATIEGDDKHIAYTIAENTTYVARKAYIKLTAPETNGTATPAVVIIPVEQAGKATVFASLAELVAAELASGTEVTVSFSNVMITEVYTTKAGYRYGLYLNVKDKDGVNDIELFYNKQENSEQVPDSWLKNGYVSATDLVGTWTLFNGQWELAMQGASWTWENAITYAEPKAVSSVVVSGKPDKKTYVDGEKFNPAGLTVTVNYTIGDPEVIDAAGADWVYETSDVMALNQTSIKVKATYNTVTSENFYEVTDLTVNPISNKTIAQFIADEGGRCYLEGIVSGNINTTYGNFDLQDETGTIYVYGSDVFEDHGVALGDKVKVIAEEYLLYKKAGNPDKDEALNVVFVSKVSAATIAIDDINMTVDDELLLSDIEATITPDAAQSATINYEVTEGTAVTISEGKIIASTEGEATITASIAAGEGYLAGSTTFTVTVSPAPVPFEGDYFVKVDDNSKLTAGEYLIVYEAGSLAFNGGLGTLDAASNTVAVTFENGKIQGTEAVLAATFTIKLAGTIQSKSGYYIGRTGNSNGMNTSKDEAYTNAISIDGNGNAVILASGGAYMRFNSTSGQERFRYFQSSSYTNQKAIQLYKKENAEPVYETVRSGLEINRYYTVCLPKKVTAIKGASFWTLNNKSQDGATAYLEEETNNLPFDAGKPFIIQATAAQLEVVYEGAATEDAGTNGALHGTLVYMNAAALAAAGGSNVYMLFSNELRPVGENNHLDANRAYVLLSELTAVAEAPQGAPGRRVRTMPMQPQVATGFEAAEANEAPRKVLINGEFFIIRGEKMYDAKGQLVK